MVAGPDLDAEPFVAFVDDLTQLLAGADMAAVFANFGQRVARQGPGNAFLRNLPGRLRSGPCASGAVCITHRSR